MLLVDGFVSRSRYQLAPALCMMFRRALAPFHPAIVLWHIGVGFSDRCYEVS